MYDVIVVGARCAGASLALLLARRGLSVLLVDRAHFPSDTMSTHLIHPKGCASLARFGVLDRLAASGCPPIGSYRIDFGHTAVEGSPVALDGVAEAFCPRRIVLDDLLVRAAAEEGAVVREGFSVTDVISENDAIAGVIGHQKGSREVPERAQVLVGADGVSSRISRALGVPSHDEVASLTVLYYAYWSGTSVTKAEFHSPGGVQLSAFPTHDGLACVAIALPVARRLELRRDVHGTLEAELAGAGSLGARVLAGRRETRFFGPAAWPNFFRRSHGPGWALVGDSGYHKDPVTAFGISDALCDAEALADAIEGGLSGRFSLDEGLASYEAERDRLAAPFYDYTLRVSALKAPSEQTLELLSTLDAAQTQRFFSMVAGSLPRQEFFHPQVT
jgi:flavin-dependent dehydrogenase